MVLHPVSPSDLAHTTKLVGPHWAGLTHKRLFITGGTGFVGKWLLETLVHANRTLGLHCEATVLSRDPQHFQRACPHLALAPGVTLLPGDVRNFAFPDTPFDMVVHGATDIAVSGAPLDVLDTCVGGTRHVLDFATHSGATDFLLLSSGAIYGHQPTDLAALPETWNGAPNPLAPGAAYGTGKRTAECLAIQAGRARNIRIKIARCFAFVGPYLPLDKHFAIGNFIRDALQGQAITIQGDGTPLRSYLYAADLAAWLWTILLQGEDGIAYNVGGDEVVSIAELAHAVNTALDTDVAIVCQTLASPNTTPERYVPGLTKARIDLGLSPSIKLQDAIQRTAQWARTGVMA
jgi:dTDP-glucose 4,6-dehydratase